ncbi:ribosome biogenesis GTPase Der [Spiroplasma endosymbiont of Danaus chrysippus]|uniref:ribosome biogenesis GTPase Der n=1 Tax=Spiroplasma endosymbiont of Danaus chrysippus TaxID=2691041 RepID=UPI00157B8324|nr:ribosome biogenesis GTPase Der [Spiroplasma endosymbiont of Danaus chrysippus]
MNKLPKVVIVGRPNVGKSSIFNRILQKKVAIIEDMPGATRDRIYGIGEWLTQNFVIIDTGGITKTITNFTQQINQQVNIALAEADIVLFVCSYQEGLTHEDEDIAKLLYRTKKPVIIIANKYDNVQNDNDKIYDYLKIGFGEPILVSASHGVGFGDLLDMIITKLPKEVHTEKKEHINLAIIGRPNVGKSSLVNTILQENRVIVSPIAGTTTDAIDSNFVYNKKQYCVIDTAGIRRKGKITEDLEKYSLIRTTNAIERSDIVLFLLDGSVEIQEQDLTIAGMAKNLDKPVIIIVNKWDLVKKNEKTMQEFTKKIKEKFKYLEYSFVVYLSALENTRIHTLFATINEVLVNMNLRIKTSILNEIINKAQLINEPPYFKGGRLKIYYTTQVEKNPPTFILMVNDPQRCHFSYERFLINQIRERFGFQGVPIKLRFRMRKSLYNKQ